MNSVHNSFTSQIISLRVCYFTWNLDSSYSLQIGATFPHMINAVSSVPECVVDPTSYASLDSSGTFAIDTTATLPLTTFTFSVTVGSP